ncbi:MAG: hypothetical protein KKI06_14180 [Euryarchaeota archaeon]|nr:hypothetical protein [Euryarchaeota archaeon]
MVKKTGERKEVNEEKKENFKTYMDSYTAVSKLWEDSYLMLYKPWLESSGELFEKAVELSKGEALEKYKEFYEEWVKIYKNSPGNFYSIQAPETYRQYYNLWAKTYEMSFDIFFENTPTVGPFKDIMEPARNAARIYADTFTRGWTKSSPGSAT